MKKIMLTLTIALAVPFAAQGALKIPGKSATRIINTPIPKRFSTALLQSDTLEWGCPVSEEVTAQTGSEALERIGSECMEEVRQTVREKPDVFDVVKVSVIYPDVLVSKSDNGFLLKGTFFLEALVLKKMEGEK